MINFSSYQENANKKHNEIPSNPNHEDYHTEVRKQ